MTMINQNDSKKQVENDWIKENLQGKVLSYSEISYKAYRFGKIEKGKRDREAGFDFQKKFDGKGNMIEERNYKSDGSSLGKTTYKYDGKGNRIEGDRYGSDGRLWGKYTWKYDEKGNKIEEDKYNSDGSSDYKYTYTYTYKYDEKGNRIEEAKYSDGSLDYKYIYDEKGNKIEENEYNSDGNLYRKYTYKYDDKGNLIENAIYNSNGIISTLPNMSMIHKVIGLKKLNLLMKYHSIFWNEHILIISNTLSYPRCQSHSVKAEIYKNVRHCEAKYRSNLLEISRLPHSFLVRNDGIFAY